MSISFFFFETMMGTLRVHFCNQQVAEIKIQEKHLEDRPGDWTSPFGHWLKSYQDGSTDPIKWGLCNFDWASPFSRRVYEALWAIPKGEVKTYKQIAEHIGAPKAARAVGQANRRNLLPLVIPCHRVVASHSLGGYAFGLDLKIKLLAFEGAHVS